MMKVGTGTSTQRHYAMKQGTNPKVVQEPLGHSNISMTLDVYSHVIPGMQESAVLHFEKSISGFSEAQSV